MVLRSMPNAVSGTGGCRPGERRVSFRTAMYNPEKRHSQIRWKHLVATVLPGFALSFLPKCPMCWMAILSALGLGTITSASSLQFLSVALLAATLVTFAFRCWRMDHYGPFVLGVAAAIALYSFKMVVHSEPGMFVSGLGFMAASVWISRSQAPKSVESGCKCAGSAGQREEEYCYKRLPAEIRHFNSHRSWS